MPVSTAVSVTFAAGTTAFEVSRTVPRTVAESNCANAADALSNRANTHRDTNRMTHLRDGDGRVAMLRGGYNSGTKRKQQMRDVAGSRRTPPPRPERPRAAIRKRPKWSRR